MSYSNALFGMQVYGGFFTIARRSYHGHNLSILSPSSYRGDAMQPAVAVLYDDGAYLSSLTLTATVESACFAHLLSTASLPNVYWSILCISWVVYTDRKCFLCFIGAASHAWLWLPSKKGVFSEHNSFWCICRCAMSFWMRAVLCHQFWV